MRDSSGNIIGLKPGVAISTRTGMVTTCRIGQPPARYRQAAGVTSSRVLLLPRISHTDPRKRGKPGTEHVYRPWMANVNTHSRRRSASSASRLKFAQTSLIFQPRESHSTGERSVERPVRALDVTKRPAFGPVRAPLQLLTFTPQRPIRLGGSAGWGAPLLVRI